MIVSRREAITGRVLLVLLMLITVVPFVSLFVTALHTSGTYPEGISWPDDPQWGNFADAFRAAHMRKLLWSSALIVIGVVPAALALRDHGRVRVRSAADARSPGRLPALRAGSDPAVRGHSHAAVLPGARHGTAQHSLGDHPAVDRALHAVLGAVDARPLRERPRGARRGRARRRRERVAAVLAHPGAAGEAGPLLARNPAVPLDLEPVPAGHRAGRRCRPNAPWPVPWAPSRGSTEPISRCSAQGRCSSSRPR